MGYLLEDGIRSLASGHRDIPAKVAEIEDDANVWGGDGVGGGSE